MWNLKGCNGVIVSCLFNVWFKLLLMVKLSWLVKICLMSWLVFILIVWMLLSKFCLMIGFVNVGK